MKNLSSFFFIIKSLVGISLGLSGCAESTLPKPYTIDQLRILAIQANPPEVNPEVDGAFTLSPLVSDPEGGGRTLTYSIQMCSDPGVGLGVVPSCEGRTDATTLKSGTTTLTAPHFTEVISPSTAGDFSGIVPSTLLSERSEMEKMNGVSWLVVFRLTAEDGSNVTSFRRIVASLRTPLNQNPAISEITADNSPLSTLPSAAASLQAFATAESEETYLVYDRSGATTTAKEVLTISWFARGGTYSSSRTEPTQANLFSPTLSDAPANPFLFAIIRDNRGGVSSLTSLTIP